MQYGGATDNFTSIQPVAAFCRWGWDVFLRQFARDFDNIATLFGCCPRLPTALIQKPYP